MRKPMFYLLLFFCFASCNSKNGKVNNQEGENDREYQETQDILKSEENSNLLQNQQTTESYHEPEIQMDSENQLGQETQTAQNSSPEKEMEKLEKSIIDNIAHFYHEKYGTNNRLEKADSENYREVNYYNIPDDEEEHEIRLISIDIPKVKNPNFILSGDLNDDDLEDLVISVYTSGGGAGGNVEWIDYFVFLQGQNDYHLVTTKRSWDISGCNGSISLDKIEDNLIIGTALCYAQGDSSCCPSLTYLTKLAILDNDFVIKSKEEVMESTD